jgi:hypothetical protein
MINLEHNHIAKLNILLCSFEFTDLNNIRHLVRMWHVKWIDDQQSPVLTSFCKRSWKLWHWSLSPCAIDRVNFSFRNKIGGANEHLYGFDLLLSMIVELLGSWGTVKLLFNVDQSSSE